MKQLCKTFLFLSLLLTVSLGMAGCFGSSAASSTPSSPPVDIPSPVSHLSISSPDTDGNVRVAGAAGFADAGSTVTVTSTPASSSVVRQSVQAKPLLTTTATVTANADGSFVITLESSVGATITVTFTLESTLSETDSSVPDNKPLIPDDVILFDVSVDGDLAQAGVVGSDGTDGFVYIVDLNEAVISKTITLTGATDAFRISVDTTTGYYYVIDDVNELLWEVSPDSGVISSASVTDPSDVVAGETGNFAIVTHDSGSFTASYYDVLTDTTTPLQSPTFPAEATHIGTDYVDLQFDGMDNHVAMVSEMSDGLFYVYKYIVFDQTSSFYAGEITLSGDDIGTVTAPGGIALFKQGTEVLVTDAENDRVLRVSFSDSSNFTVIDVGTFPTGVTVDDANHLAYVVNSLDDTVSVIDLTTDQQISTVDTGILPLEVALDSTSSLSTAVAVSAFDNTVTIIEN